MTEDEPQFWETNTHMDISDEQVAKGNTEIVRQRLNLTEGLSDFYFLCICCISKYQFCLD